MTRTIKAAVLTAAFLLGGAEVAAADDVELALQIPWAATFTETTLGEGHLVRAGTWRAAVLEMEGPFGPLGPLLMTCPFFEHQATGAYAGVSAYCAFSADDGSAFFVSIGCTGWPDSCEGVYTVLDGSGRFLGIVGRGEAVVSTLVVGEDGSSSAGVVGLYGLYNIIPPELAP